MSKKKQAVNNRFPWLFLALILIFGIWMTYLYGVFYIPSLPQAEIPPYLSDSPLTDPVTADTARSDSTQAAQTAASPPVTDNHPSETAEPSTAAASENTAANVVSRRPGVYNILCAGRDDAAFNTDALLLISFDAENSTANVVQIPRDTYFDGNKINAYWAKQRTAAKKNGAADADAAAMDALCRSLEKALCIKIDHWVLCGLSAVREVVDALGGVTVDVPYDMDYDDPDQNLSIHLTAGIQTLNGTQAEGLIRFRSGYIRGDLGRIDMQKLFLSALLEQGKQISLLALPSLVMTASNHLRSALSFSDLLYFAKNAQKLDASRVRFLTLPGTDCRANGDSGAWYYVLSANGTLDVVNQYLNVYASPVTKTVFDRDMRLTDASNPTLMSYYRKDLSADVTTAASLGEDGVSIAVIPK